ncbi:MAG TPA: ABC transporter substrate-binding protein [Chloroflexia bacterium]|nr:ABC transporter substrate-binding protein [Chloroflexia bacterium]
MAVVGLLAIAVALAYFLLVVTPINEPARGGTYVEGIVVNSAVAISINPLYATNSLSQDVSSLVFRGLTRSEPGKNPGDPGQVIVPDLADSWTASPDGSDWEFHLRHDLRWQDGFPVTAQDVVYTVNLIKNDEFNGLPDLAKTWKNVTASRLGDYVVRFHLEQPWPAFLSYTNLGILPAHKLEGKIKPGELATTEFNQAPVGNGPYMLAPGGLSPQGVTLIANPLYHDDSGKQPYLDKIWFRFYPSATAALSALQANQVDGVSEVSADDLKRFGQLKKADEISAPLSTNTFLFLNLQRSALFGQKEVRQALAYSINKQDIVSKALQGQAQISNSPILASSWAYKADIKTYSFNIAQAEKLLDDAGWKLNRDGVRERNGQTLVFKILTDDSSDKREVANTITDDLKAVGVIAQLDVAPSTRELNDAVKASNYDALLLSVQSILNDPDQYFNWHSNYAEPGDNHQNYANWKLDRADKLLEDARKTVNQDARRKLYLDWQTIWADELPSIPLYSSTYSYVVSTKVGGVQRENLKVINTASDRLKDIASRYIFTSTRFGS